MAGHPFAKPELGSESVVLNLSHGLLGVIVRVGAAGIAVTKQQKERQERLHGIPWRMGPLALTVPNFLQPRIHVGTVARALAALAAGFTGARAPDPLEQQLPL
jgi:hypothetical protein